MKLKYLILFVTVRCNSRCVMCFNYNLNAVNTNELTLEEYRKIAKNLKSELKSLMISGGEPSLRRDLPEICKIFYEHCNLKKIYLPLNGLDKEKTINIVEKILLLCPNIQLNAGLSVNGIGEIHDTQCGISGSFSKVMSTHEALSKLSEQFTNLKRGVITTVTKININQLEELVNYIYNLPSRPDYHDIMVCRIQAGSKTDKELLISPSEYENVLNIADKYLYFYGKKKYNRFFLGNIGYIRHKILNHIYLNAYKNKRIINCKAPEFIRVIEADGRVRICELKDEVGNIRDYNYDLNKMDIDLNISSKKVNCACTHPCFVVPSLKYSSNIIKSCTSILVDNLNFQKVMR